MKYSVLVRVEFDSLGQVTDAEEGLFDCLLNVLDPECAENVGIKGGIQFHRVENAPFSDMDLIAALEVKQREARASMDANWSQRKQAHVRHLDKVIEELKTQAARRSDYEKALSPSGGKRKEDSA